MMRLGRRATLLVALSLLTSAATAYAECAWVLSVTINGLATHALDSFPSSQECKQRLYSPAMKQYVEDEARRGLVLNPVCLPDTVDPRGPKGN
jgi:hypothetical protein